MAAQNGSLTLLGLRTARTYVIDVYLPDAAGTIATFSPTGPAASTSPSSFRVPEDVMIKDFSVAASPTATNGTISINGSVVSGGVIRYANCINSLPFRIPLNVPVRSGDFIGITQAA